MPFSTSLVMWVNNMSWTAYGYLVADDVLIYGPNALSLLLSSLQLSLFVVYGFGGGSVSEKKALEEEDLKNGIFPRTLGVAAVDIDI
eukprot:gene39500-48808_t